MIRWALLCVVWAGCSDASGTAPVNPPADGGDAAASPTIDDLSFPPLTDLAPPPLTDMLPAGVIAHSILSSATDPAINNPDSTNLVYSSGAGNGRLLVFFPGSGSVPSHYQKFLGFAASTGYHVIGLGYPNDSGSVSNICGNDLTCYDNLRVELWSGQDKSPQVDVNASNCIHNRLSKMLGYLVAQYPTEGWDVFYYMGEPAWNKLTASGHSQGGGHAAYLASREKIARVVMFSSVSDSSNATNPPTPAAWIATHVTPVDRYYGIDHKDDLAYNAKCHADWKRLGMDALGALVDVDVQSPPYGGSHELSGSRMLSSPHNQVVADSVPLENGVPVYQDAWKYMIGP
jgi:hypothetical protein